MKKENEITMRDEEIERMSRGKIYRAKLEGGIKKVFLTQTQLMDLKRYKKLTTKIKGCEQEYTFVYVPTWKQTKG